MLNFLESFFVILVIIGSSIAFLTILNRLWPTEARRPHNDIVGFQVTVVGTIYAVIIGFMLFAVWTDFEAARANVDAESNALVNLSRVANILPRTQSAKIHAIAARYADVMVEREWPAMSKGAVGEDSAPLSEELWRILTQPEALDPAQQIGLNRAIAELTHMTQHRRLRQLESQTKLPDILWAVLIVGGVITITSACIFGTKSFTLHLVQVFALSALVGLSLMAVAQIDRPYQGSVSVEPDAFIEAQQVLHQDALKGF